MKPIVDEVAKKLRDALKERIDDFRGLYVFGSQARGEATEYSDVDIVVLFEKEYIGLPDELFEILFQMGIEYYDILDLGVIPYTLKNLQQNYILYDEVVRQGVFYGSE